MKLSVVTSIYNSSSTIMELNERLIKAAKEIVNDSFEIIYVNDGSTDESYHTLKKIILDTNENYDIQLVDLSRNFGQHKALMTGLKFARGNHIFMLDSDLEENPNWLIEMYNQIHKTGSDMVFGYQENRRGNFFDKISGYIFYKLFNLISNVKIERNLVTARVMSSRYVKNLLKHKESEIYLPGIFKIIGFKQVKIPVKKDYLNNTTYSFRMKISMMINSITSFSSTPLKMSFYVGISLIIISFIFIVKILYDKIFFDAVLTGWSSLIISIWFIGGMNIFFIGLVGIYISKMYVEVKQRPTSIIKEIYHSNENISNDKSY